MADALHSLLRRQLKRHIGDPDAVPAEWRSFIDAVNQAYRQSDLDRLMIERSLDLSSEELIAANAEMRRAVTALQDAHLALESRVAERTRELVQVEEQLRQATKMEAIGRLAGGVAHDFNNLLVVIVSQAEFLLERSKLESSTQAAREILDAAESAAGLIRQLLAFSRRQALSPVTLDVNTLVRRTTTMLSRLIGEHIDLVVELDPAAGHVSADRSQLQQVLINLATNARDAMPDGGRLTIATSVRESDTATGAERLPDGPCVVLTVSDTGMGMTPDVVSRVFEPFFTTKEQQRGTGLGLATAYGIVRQSNGRLEVESEPGHGSRFRVWLPRVDVVEAPAGEPAAVVRSQRTGVVMVVEDQDAVRRSIRARLEHAGYVVFDAADGPAAIKMAASLPSLDLLITDVVMPHMSGPELAATLAERQAGLRVVYMTGYVNDAELARELSDPGRLVLQKPFRADRLLSVVQQALM